MDKIEDFHPLILNAPKQKYLFNLLIQIFKSKKIIRKFYLSDNYENQQTTYIFFGTENINKNIFSYETDTSSE